MYNRGDFLHIFTDNQIFELLYREKPTAVAGIMGSKEYPAISGTLKLYQTKQGVFAVMLVYGLPKGTSDCDKTIFAVHIHNGTGCSGSEIDPFANAGTHYNPNNFKHPFHSGYLPAIFSTETVGWNAFFTDRFKVSEVLGLPVIIHSKPDDFTTQPSGNSGDKIACGIIMPV